MCLSASPSLLKAVNRLNLEILTIGYAGVQPGWCGHVVSPVYSRLYYITDGSFTVWTAASLKMELKQGKWYLIPSGYSFDYECSNLMKHFYFHVKLCDFDGTDLLRNCAAPLCFTPEQAVDCAIFKKCLTGEQLTDGLHLRQAAFDILITFIERYKIPIDAQDYSPCIFKAVVYIKQNLSMQLSITEIAENIFVSKSTLTKHFQKELHMSVNEYICNTIMAAAERLLMTSNISIHDLSQKFGYSDQLYFSRRFKEIFGKSPREYRKQKLL